MGLDGAQSAHGVQGKLGKGCGVLLSHGDPEALAPAQSFETDVFPFVLDIDGWAVIAGLHDAAEEDGYVLDLYILENGMVLVACVRALVGGVRIGGEEVGGGRRGEERTLVIHHAM